MARRRKQASTADGPTGGAHPAFFDDEHHHEALEQLAVRMLAAGDIKSAFKFADRRCRIAPRAQAHHYTLRAEALHRMGDRDAALSDIRRTLELLPEDIAANRRMLEWGHDAEKLTAAELLREREPNFKSLVSVIKTLRKISKRKAFAAVQATDTHIIGWAAWSGRKSVEFRIDSEGEITRTAIAADPDHPLGPCLGHAASIAIPRPTSQAPQIVALSDGKKSFYNKLLAPPSRSATVASAAKHRALPARRGDAGNDQLTIIVPVYDDLEATKACLASLLPELQSRTTALLVNDASPDARITTHLNSLAGHEHIRLITNDRNLGFVGSVNLALTAITAGDIILLNADTVVTPGFATRLRAAARSEPNIGTVVPLSNNGEFTSFPVPNTPNEMTSMEHIIAIDDAARAVNDGTIVDIPNGTGFCLYVTRECLDAIGILSDIFESGYLEDADFCLRAREAGFRNVCAPSIYVGHAGSRSFGAQKRALVMRNMGRLEARFPDYRNECAMFVKADPLQPVRAAIERQLPSLNTGATLLIHSPGPSGTVAAARAAQLAAEGSKSILAEFRPNASPPVLRVMEPTEGVPQSLAFEISAAEARQALSEYLRQSQLSRLEFVGPPSVPGDILDLLLGLGVPFDVLASEAMPVQWHDLLNRADRVLAPDAQAAAFVQHEPPHPKPVRLKPRKRATPVVPGAPADDAAALGLLALDSINAADHELIAAVAKAADGKRPGPAIAVIGKTLNDLELMKNPNVSVTGAIDQDEIDDLLRHYGVKALLVGARRPVFGHPLIGALLASRFPVALFDWSAGRVAAERNNLLLDPALSNLEAAKAVRNWFDRI